MKISSLSLRVTRVCMDGPEDRSARAKATRGIHITTRMAGRNAAFKPSIVTGDVLRLRVDRLARPMRRLHILATRGSPISHEANGERCPAAESTPFRERELALELRRGPVRGARCRTFAASAFGRRPGRRTAISPRRGRDDETVDRLPSQYILTSLVGRSCSPGYVKANNIRATTVPINKPAQNGAYACHTADPPPPALMIVPHAYTR